MLACLGCTSSHPSFENFIGVLPSFFAPWSTCYVITRVMQVPFLDQLFDASGRSSSRWGGADISWRWDSGRGSPPYLAGASVECSRRCGLRRRVRLRRAQRRRGELVTVVFDNLTLFRSGSMSTCATRSWR